jgi:hypothetical protein
MLHHDQMNNEVHNTENLYHIHQQILKPESILLKNNQL